MLLPMRIRFKIGRIFMSLGLSSTPIGGGVCSRIFHAGVSDNLAEIKRRGMSIDQAAKFCIKKEVDKYALSTDTETTILLELLYSGSPFV
jgi:hypothetical protein